MLAMTLDPSPNYYADAIDGGWVDALDHSLAGRASTSGLDRVHPGGARETFRLLRDRLPRHGLRRRLLPVKLLVLLALLAGCSGRGACHEAVPTAGLEPAHFRV